jgi:predicted SAM-dependent methyltransferase
MLKQLLKRRLSHGIKSATRNQLDEVSIFLKHRKGVKKAKKLPYSIDLKLHLGCGPRLKEGWINIDLEDCADITLDLREPLPFPNDSCSLIYSEHFLEHIDYPEPVTSLLMECQRVLKSGGVLSIVVPDLEMVLTSYVKGGTEEYYAAQRKWHPDWCKTHMEHINYNFRQNNEHRFAYDFETLKYLLEKSGFIEVRQRNFDDNLDSEDRIVGSLYVDCLKP